MAQTAPKLLDQKPPQLDTQDVAIKSILLVDDSRLQRRILLASLKRWGYHVIEAASGAEALAICKKEPIDLVISDWMMPEMDGIEFCQLFRQLDRASYGYFILLTSKSEKDEVALGLDNGADDFLTKPVNASELRARIAAGERILQMEHRLQETNRLVSETLKELQLLYDTLDRDLVEAKKLQQSLLPDRHQKFGPATLSMILRSSGHVGGDLVGSFPINDTQIGFYGIDVSGHGISSALMTARLAGYLSAAAPKQNVAIKEVSPGAYIPRPPAQSISLLNDLVLEEMDTEHYFTLLLGYLDLETGEMVMAQAGHPYPLVQRKNGDCEFVGNGGLPVGLIEGAEYEEFRTVLASGDRIIIPSDGVTECPNADNDMLEEEGFEELMRRNESLHGQKLLEALVWDLSAFSGETDFPDDVSAILLEFGD
ncbi:PP2C family protein-serine/threonine phosphatase [Cochlodiniinecator piscidefendens]|uniref:PP2C family protein-serine/threonine phosphatase n=1 Tax=Cochlodiniinecator piscidefendens TaxID=2715756 RepID=UPI00140B9AF9|nr:SpoIIE family protein phosphatase [Cochlodiniinecator piscidefendens]